MVYTSNWGIICHLPRFRGTRNNHWLIVYSQNFSTISKILIISWSCMLILNCRLYMSKAIKSYPGQKIRIKTFRSQINSKHFKLKPSQQSLRKFHLPLSHRYLYKANSIGWHRRLLWQTFTLQLLPSQVPILGSWRSWRDAGWDCFGSCVGGFSILFVCFFFPHVFFVQKWDVLSLISTFRIVESPESVRELKNASGRLNW